MIEMIKRAAYSYYESTGYMVRMIRLGPRAFAALTTEIKAKYGWDTSKVVEWMFDGLSIGQQIEEGMTFS